MKGAKRIMRENLGIDYLGGLCLSERRLKDPKDKVYQAVVLNELVQVIIQYTSKPTRCTFSKLKHIISYLHVQTSS